MAFADRTGRLGRRWDSLDAYLEYFCSTTGQLLDHDDPLLRHYLEHDLRDGLVRLSADALVEPTGATRSSATCPGGTSASRSAGRTPSGASAATPPRCTPPTSSSVYAAQCVSVVALDGLDHAGAIMTVRGAQATAALLREALA